MTRPAAVLLTACFACGAQVRFRDIASQAGLNAFIASGGPVKNYVLEVNGSGVCWLDYDGDGWMDVYLVNGSTLEELRRTPAAPSQRRHRNYLYRNNGRNARGEITFTDVTLKARVPGAGWGFGCAAADYDNDGDADLFISNFGPNILYRNAGQGVFEDATETAGVAGGAIWHAGAAFADYDNDGHLDLFVPGYLDFDAAKPELKTCDYRGIAVHACGPLGYRGAPDVLYRNRGDGTFEDATARAGVADSKLYFGFQAVFDDFDNDGDADLFVGNDSNPNYLYRNRGDGTFEETGLTSGAALSGDGKEMSSMGVAAGDYDGDGLIDLFITTFADDNYVLLRNDGGGFFSDVSFAAGVGEPTVPYLGWAAFFFDYDNDGRPDLFCANGHVYPEVDGKIRETYRQPLQSFRNLGGKFAETSRETGLLALPPQSSRGGAFADFDNDGDVDFLVSVMDGRPRLLENTGTPKGNWLRVRLRGTKSNRMGVGARVQVTAAGATQHATLRAGESYLSSNDPRLHFGLGAAQLATVEVLWPGGSRDRLASVTANRTIEIVEGAHSTISPSGRRQ